MLAQKSVSLPKLFLRLMKIKEIVDALERFAPLPLQDDFDNAGLQIGLTEVEATGALLCLDVTEAVVDEAILLGCNLIISHHPLLFHPLKSITGKDYIQRCILKAIKNEVAIYSSHTNLDNTANGVNYKMAEKIGLKNVRILSPMDKSLLKLVTFVPVKQADRVRGALFEAGCGHIGNYDACSYNLQGELSFHALEGTHAFCGKVEEYYLEQEIRIETILPVFLKLKVQQTLMAVHPYEEPVFDFYPLDNTWAQIGAGIVGKLSRPMLGQSFLKRIKKVFEVASVRYTELSEKKISKVAFCGGSGSFLIAEAIRSGADVFITGEIKYHEFFGHENEITLIEIGHYESEQYTKELFRDIIACECPSVQTFISKINTNPIKYF